MNKIQKIAGIGLFYIGSSLMMTIPTPAETFVKCDNYINIRQGPYIQSAIVGYMYNDNLIEQILKEQQGWIEIKSGNIKGWIDKQYVIQDNAKFKHGYTVAKIHPQRLSVYISPNKKSTVYTTVYQNQQIECIQYENDWLTLAFDDGTYGFIDAYEAELKTYYTFAQPPFIASLDYYQDDSQNESTPQIINNDPMITYDLITQSENYQPIKEYYEEEVPQQIYYQDLNNSYQEIEQSMSTDFYNNYYSEENSSDSYLKEQVWIDTNYSFEEEQQETYQSFEETTYQQPIQEEEIIYDVELNEDENIQNENSDIFYEEYYEDNEYNNDEEPLNDEQDYEFNQENFILEEQDNSNNDIIDYADQYVGNPYVYGGDSLTEGIDCSHFVYQVLTDTGHYDGGYTTSDGWSQLGDSVSSLNQAQAGDVIVYPGHVALYDGNGGIVEAKGSDYGITHDREADHGTILSIRHFD